MSLIPEHLFSVLNTQIQNSSRLLWRTSKIESDTINSRNSLLINFSCCLVLLCAVWFLFSSLNSIRIYFFSVLLLIYLFMEYRTFTKIPDKSFFIFRYFKIYHRIADIIIFTSVIRAAGWDANVIICAVLTILIFFLYSYSAIAFLLIIPSDIRTSFPDELISLNQNFLSSAGFYKYDREILYLIFIIALLMFHPRIILVFILLIFVSLFLLISQMKIIWGKLVPDKS